MISRLFIAVASVTLLTVTCAPKKKSVKTETKSSIEEPAITLDTIDVLSTQPVVKEIYRASNSKLHDIIHTRLDVSFDWANSRLNGKAQLNLKPHFYPTRTLFLNARGMEIKSVVVSEVAFLPVNKKVGNKIIDVYAEEKLIPVSNSSFKYENDSIKIDLGRIFKGGESYYVTIDYVAKPDELRKQGGSSAISSDKGLYFINPKGENTYKMPQIWTQGETQSNSVWFPTIDSPNAKTTQEIYMTVDEKFTTLSNGLLVDTKKNSDGTKTDHWRLEEPHAPYLAMMAVGMFKKVVDAPWNGKEISYYVEKEYEPHAKGIFGDTKEMIEFYSTRLGVPYAWPKYSQIAVRDYVSGAMENTSATLHGDFAVYQTTREMIDGKKGEDIIAHELFHQWFGDLVTSESWSNLPLNESFATYGEYLWEEYKNGRDAADAHHYGSRQGYMMSDREVNLIRFNYEEREDMFDAFSYNKGGQVLHMLRKAVGDDAFFASLKNYLETNKFKSAEIHNLRLAFEEVTGEDMNWFFNQWFLSRGRPKLNVSQKYNPSAGMVEVTVEQKQDLKKYPLYKLPVDIDVYVNGKAERTRVWVSDIKQMFSVKASGQPQLVNFDAERQLLCDLEYSKTREEYIFQYKNVPLYNDRLEALNKLEEQLQDATVLDLFKEAAAKDKFSGIRNYAIGKLISVPADKLAEIKPTLLSIYSTDKNTKVRARALSSLNRKFGKDADIMELNNQALSEISYAICGEALEAIAKNDPKTGMEKAKAFETENGKDVIFPIADLYANHGNETHIPYFQNNLKYMTGFEIAGYISMYAKLGKRLNSATDAMIVVKDLETLTKGANRFTKYGAVKGIRDIAAAWEGKEKALKAKVEAAKTEKKDAASLEKELQDAAQTKDAIIKIYNAVK
jgi:aminopeptidase N